MVLAMGKQGGGELNVSSDIDLIFVYPEDGDTQVTQAGPAQPVEPRVFHSHGQKADRRPGRNHAGRLYLPRRHGAAAERQLGAAGRQPGDGRAISDRAGPRMGALCLGQGARRHRQAGGHRRSGRHRAPVRVPPLPGLRRDRCDPQHAWPDPRRGQPPGAAAPGPQQQRQAGPRRHPRNRIPGAGIPIDTRRARRRAARALHARHLAHGGRQRATWSRPSSKNCWPRIPFYATWNTGCNTSTMRKPIPCPPARPTAWWWRR